MSSPMATASMPHFAPWLQSYVSMDLRLNHHGADLASVGHLCHLCEGRLPGRGVMSEPPPVSGVHGNGISLVDKWTAAPRLTT